MIRSFFQEHNSFKLRFSDYLLPTFYDPLAPAYSVHWSKTKELFIFGYERL